MPIALSQEPTRRCHTADTIFQRGKTKQTRIAEYRRRLARAEAGRRRGDTCVQGQVRGKTVKRFQLPTHGLLVNFGYIFIEQI